MKAKKKELEVVARVTIRRASEMTPQGRKELATWLRLQAKDLIRDGAQYGKLFVARYLV